MILSPQLPPFFHAMHSTSRAFPQPNTAPWQCFWCRRTINGCLFTCGFPVGVSFRDFLSPAPYHPSTLPSCNAPCFSHLSSAQHHRLAMFLTTCGLAISQFDLPTLATLIQASCVLPQLNYTTQQCFSMVWDYTQTLICIGSPLRKFPWPCFLMSITSMPNTSSLPAEKSYKIQLIYFTFQLLGGFGEPIRSRGEIARHFHSLPLPFSLPTALPAPTLTLAEPCLPLTLQWSNQLWLPHSPAILSEKKIEMEWDKKVRSPFSTSWLH